MKEKFLRFMQGRYGIDTLGRFLLGSALVSYLLYMFIGKSLLYFLALIFLCYAYFRMFSKDIYKRSSENQNFLKKTAGIRRVWAGRKYHFQQMRAFHIYKCPTCKQKIRIPRGKGRIEIRCPKCNSTFIRHSQFLYIRISNSIYHIQKFLIGLKFELLLNLLQISNKFKILRILCLREYKEEST